VAQVNLSSIFFAKEKKNEINQQIKCLYTADMMLYLFFDHEKDLVLPEIFIFNVYLPIILGLREWPKGTERNILGGNSLNLGSHLSEGGMYQPRTKPKERKEKSGSLLIKRL
jgi:hypothetical protein